MMPAQDQAKGTRLLDWVREWDRDWHRQNGKRNPSHTSLLTTDDPLNGGPLLVLDYMRTLWGYKFRTYVGFDGTADFNSWLEAWLDNFARDDRRVAFTLASRILFLSNAEFRYLGGYILYQIREITGQVNQAEFLFIDLDGGINLAEFFDINHVAGYKDVRDDGQRLFVPPEFLLDPVKRIEQIDVAEDHLDAVDSMPPGLLECIRSSLKSTRSEYLRQITDIREKFQKSHRHFLVLLVDFIGSGGTAEHDLCRILPNYDFQTVFLVPFVATDDALDCLEKLRRQYPSLTIINGLRITRRHKVLEDQCTFFSENERLVMRQLCEKYHSFLVGHPDVAKHGDAIKYGFDACQLLFVRQRNTPNNSLPLVWAQCEKWTALFPRTASYEAHTLKGTP